MRITIKCPNCGEQIDQENVFCTVCGVRLSAVADAAEPAETTASVLPAADDEIAQAGGAMFCSMNPREHAITNPELGFCPVCGAPLVDRVPDAETAEPPMSAPLDVPGDSDEQDAPASPAKPRTCRNGHTYDDPFLTFCPECGMPLEEGVAEELPARPSWTCACGQVNAEEDRFCVNCRAERGGMEKPQRKKKAEPGAKMVIPEGMYLPTDDDLRRK